MKAQDRERDDLKQELARLPKGSNVILLHPTAIKAVADKLMTRSNSPLHRRRAKLKLTIAMLDDMGELGPIVCELIRSITLYRDDDDWLLIKVEASLVPFLQDSTAAAPKLGIARLVAEDRSRHVSPTWFYSATTNPITIRQSGKNAPPMSSGVRCSA